MWAAAHPARRVLFLSYRSQKRSNVFIFQEERVHWYAGGVRGRDLVSVLDAIMNEGKFNLCVLDGLVNPDSDQDFKPVWQDVNTFTGKSGRIGKTIIIASMNVRLRGIEEMSSHAFHCLDSWPLETHMACFQAMLLAKKLPGFLCEDIVNYCSAKEMHEDNHNDDDMEMAEATEDDDGQVMKDFEAFERDDGQAATRPDADVEMIDSQVLEKYVEDKYFYAGGSARFMYGRTMSLTGGHSQPMIYHHPLIM